MTDRPKLEKTIVLENNPVPLVIWDFNVAVFHVINWYEKISGSFKPEVEEKLVKGAFALHINRGPDMLPRHTYRMIFVADKRFDETSNYWRNNVMQTCPAVKQAWVDHAEREKVDFRTLNTDYKGTRGEKTEEFYFVYNICRDYATSYFPFFEANGYEADDFAGAVYRLSRDSDKDALVHKRQIFLCSLDRDWSQLVDEAHKVYFANTRYPFPNEKIQERLVGNEGVIEHTAHRMGFDITHPSQLASFKVLHSDMGDNLPKGTPIELFDLCEPHPEFNLDKEPIWESLKESCNDPKANDRPDHLEQTLRQFAKICVEAPVKL
jgi:hypothetical protein